MEKSKKRTIIQAMICIGLLCVIWGGYLVTVRKINQNNKVKNVKNQEVVVDYNVLSGIEDVNTQNDKVHISGWAFRRGVDKTELNVVLQPVDTTDSKVLETRTYEREDIKKEFDLETGECGFNAEIDTEEMEQGVCYEILLSLSYEQKDSKSNDITEVMKKITTNQYLYDGVVYRYNPKSFDEPVILDEHIQNVVKQGQVYMYDVEKRVWIYLYENRLFCIADVAQVVSLEKVPSVPIAFYTFFDELVPEEKKESYLVKGFDSVEIYLEEGHCFSGEDEEYYVVEVELPEYPISYVRMGTYGNRGEGWISRNEFQLDFVTD